jgi:hypothetical protein
MEVGIHLIQNFASVHGGFASATINGRWLKSFAAIHTHAKDRHSSLNSIVETSLPLWEHLQCPACGDVRLGIQVLFLVNKKWHLAGVETGTGVFNSP